MDTKIFDYGEYYYIVKYKLQTGEIRYAMFKEDAPEEYCLELITDISGPIESFEFIYVEDTLKDLAPDNYEDGCDIADIFVVEAINNGIKEGAVVSFGEYEGSRKFYKVYLKGELPDTDEKLTVVNLEEWHKAHMEWFDSFNPTY